MLGVKAEWSLEVCVLGICCCITNDPRTEWPRQQSPFVISHSFCGSGFQLGHSRGGLSLPRDLSGLRRESHRLGVEVI